MRMFPRALIAKRRGAIGIIAGSCIPNLLREGRENQLPGTRVQMEEEKQEEERDRRGNGTETVLEDGAEEKVETKVQRRSPKPPQHRILVVRRRRSSMIHVFTAGDGTTSPRIADIAPRR